MRDAPIKLVTKGKSPSLLDTVRANQLISVVNTLCAVSIVPDNIGKFTMAGDKAILDFSALEARLEKLEGKAGIGLDGGNTGQVLTKLGNDTGNYGWQNASGGNISDVSNHLKQLINSLANGSINAACNINSNAITVSMNFPNFPNANF